MATIPPRNRERTLARHLSDHLFRYHRTAHEGHDGHAVAHHLYGAIIVLAVLITADDHTTHPLEAAVVLAVTVAVLLAMESYADVIAQEITLRRQLTTSERVNAIRELLGVTGAAELPLLFLLLAGIGVISVHAAFWFAEAATIALLFYYGYVARRLEGRPGGKAITAGLAVAGIGLVLAIGKGYVHL